MKDNLSKEIVKKKYLQALGQFNQERMQRFISIVLTLVALSFFGLFAINPTISTILKLRKELDDSRYIDSQLEVKIGNISRLRNQYTNLQGDLSVITEAISTKPKVHLLFAQIQAVSQQSNVKISKIQNYEIEVTKNNKAPGKKYYSYSFSITGNGTSKDTYKFVSDITNMQRIISIDIFSISSSSIPNSQEVSFAIQGTAYFMEQEI